MKLQVRRNVFETNSSSVHSITMCTEEDFKAWKKGLKYFDSWNECLIDAKDVALSKNSDDEDKYDDKQYLGYNEYWEHYEEEFEGFEEKFITPGGEKVIAFGYYGADY